MQTYALPVSAGDAIGFTVTVTNNGTGIARNVALNDALPTDAGTSWSIDGGTYATYTTCAIAGGTLSCGPSDLAGGASYTVHVSSPTTAATADSSPVDNTANVTTTNDGSDTASASVEVLGAAIDVAKSADNPSVSAGDAIGFTVTVTNNGTGIARNVALNDALPADAGTSWSIDGGTYATYTTCAIAGGALSCGPSDLAGGASYTVHLSSPTTAATAGSSPVDNTADVTTTNDGSDTASASVEVLGAAIDVAKSADQGTVDAGDPIGYVITVSNSGAGTAKNVTVSDTVPTNAGLSWSIDAGGSDAGCSISAGTLTCAFGSLGSGASKHVHITSPTTAATCGTVDNTATVTTSNVGSDHVDHVKITVNCGSIHITKSADQGTVDAGDPIGYVITVSNSGAGTAKNVTVSDTVPTNAGLSWGIDAGGSDSGCSISAGTLTCTFGSLASGATRHVHITSPTTAATCGTVDNSATVTTTNDGSDHVDHVQITVNCPHLAITKTADAASVDAGDPIGFVITVTNTGAGTAKNVTVTDPLPTNAGLSWSIDAGGSDSGCSISAGTLTCTFGSLASG